MKRFLLILIILAAFVINVTSQEAKPTIAILDVAATNTTEVKSQVIYEYIVDVVNRTNLYTLVERSALQAAIKEMEISASGMVDDTTAAQIGKLAGAEFILISNLIVDDGFTYLSTRIVSVESGQVSETAMLKAEEGEYIASLANRTISQLLGAPKPVAETAESETAVKDEPTEEKKNVNPKPAGKVSYPGPRLSLTGRVSGIIPLLDDSEIFDFGYGLTGDINYRILYLRKGSLSAGVGIGAFLDKASSGKGVVYPYNLFSIPLSANVKYRINFGRIYLTAKIAAGGSLNMFVYTETAPTDNTTVITVTPAILPGISAGYALSRKLGFSFFADWSMIFFTAYPYTAINAGLAVDLNL